MLEEKMYVYIAEVKNTDSDEGYVRMYIDYNYESATKKANEEAKKQYGPNASCNVIDCEKEDMHTQEIGYALGLSIEQSKWNTIHDTIDIMPPCKLNLPTS